MSLPRADVRFRLPPDLHKAMIAICKVDDLELQTYVERVVTAAIRERCRGVAELAQLTAGLDLTTASSFAKKGE